ncbi:hypothetical protein ECLG_05105, partial [Escherichia coli TA271]
MISVYDDQSVLFCSWSVVLSGVILRIRILNGRGGRLSTTTEARYCEVVLPLMVIVFFRHPATITLYLNQQANFRRTSGPPFEVVSTSACTPK